MKMRRYGVKPINRLSNIAEGDLTNVNVSAKDDMLLLMKVQKLKDEGSSSNKEEFVKYVDNKYGVSPSKGSDFIETIKVLCASIAGLGVGRGLAMTISHIVTYVRTLIAKLMGKSITFRYWLSKKGVLLTNIKMDKYTNLVGKDRLKDLLTSSPSTFNLTMVITVLVSALLTFVLYKIYRAVTKTIVSESKNSNAVKKYRELEVKKAILESHVLFVKSNTLLEGDVDTSQKSTSSLIVKIVDDAKVLCNDLIKGITKTAGFMMKNFPTFTAAILICVGYVYSF